MLNASQVRKQFWRDHPNLSREKIPDYSGRGWMYTTDTRCAFVDYIDMLHRNGQISDALAQNITLGGE